MKSRISLATGVFVIAVVLGILELWFTPWSPVTFIKLELTLGAVFVIVLAVWFVNKEYDEDKHNRSGQKLDD